MSDPRGTKTFRKKPVAVKAIRFNPRQRTWPPGVYRFGHAFFIGTANGEVRIAEGTWICWQKVKGKVDAWPVAPEIFEATYDPA